MGWKYFMSMSLESACEGRNGYSGSLNQRVTAIFKIEANKDFVLPSMKILRNAHISKSYLLLKLPKSNYIEELLSFNNVGTNK